MSVSENNSAFYRNSQEDLVVMVYHFHHVLFNTRIPNPTVVNKAGWKPVTENCNLTVSFLVMAPKKNKILFFHGQQL